MPIGHLRIDLDATAADKTEISQRLQRVLAELRSVHGLEIAIRIGRNLDGLDEFACSVAAASGGRDLRWLVLGRDHRPIAKRLFAGLRAIWLRRNVGGVIGVGVAGDFVALNRHPTIPKVAAFVAFGIDAQVHAFDDRSVLETLTTHTAIVRQARRIAGGLPVSISPATFGRPHRPLPDLGDRDPREGSPPAAVWTLGCLAACVAAQTDSITFESSTQGQGRGDACSTVLDAWHSFPAERIAALPADHRRSVVGVALHSNTDSRILLGNLRAETQIVHVTGLPAGKATLTCRCAASAAPARFRRRGARAAITLPGYAVLQLDLTPS